MRLWTQLALLWLVVPLLACLVDDGDSPDPLGEPYGDYTIEGHLVENECGEGVPALDPIAFDVELRHLDHTAVWRQAGAPLVYGTVSPTGTWEVQQSVVQDVYDPDPITGTAGCALTQTETIRLEGAPLPIDAPPAQDAAAADAGDPIDAGATQGSPGEMNGTLEIVFVPTAGSDCSPSVSAFGGPFTALPCRVRYDLTAQRTE